MKEQFEDISRERYEDKAINENLSNENFEKNIFVRVVAMKKTFNNVDFKYCVFDSVYFRSCKFNSCDFTGSKFINSNLRGSSFSNCDFKYSSFDKTKVDNDILHNSAPSEENWKLDFARTLRTNYQQLGDSKSVNMAIQIELASTEEHLRNAWKSKKQYYRGKYQGIDRLQMFFEWLAHKFLGYIWGNGESGWRIVKSLLIIFILLALIDASIFSTNCNFLDSLIRAPSIFFGTITPQYPSFYLTTITVIRLVIIGLFISLIVKRLNRR
ncbi:pentapeptide repeat-containing protein [Legionella spiritensis]|uniref:Pentapeptide repeats (8 copies) n=1 Tax=Legionella spiritensis TaxID=452 RepID=A0A0W0YYG0_LEGSP|nr:pentapeptide repeat-containing protein [Legionella spiritensis]KTD61890.1 Pentapeptide repeats (8 copies) [Legionella spiritensis]SNV31253.1 Uncharacterized protein conserved in bacteria [Legionella spiritensis]